MPFCFSVEQSSAIEGLVAFAPTIGKDSRGNIWTSFETEVFEPYLPSDLSFKHDKFSRSIGNVLRGIHGDSKSWKLVTCVYGSIFQVVVDLRKSSPSFGKWQAFDISEASQKMVLIPPGCGNAYYVQSEVAVYHYKLAYPGQYLDADDQFSVRWNDPSLNIAWPCQSPALSERDINAPLLGASGLA